jgi:hypothetical protein
MQKTKSTQRIGGILPHARAARAVRRWIAEWRDMPLELGVGAAAVAAGVYAVMLIVPT